MKMALHLLTILMTAFITSEAVAGGGGISGGSKLITVQVCDLDMPGQCRIVSYVDRFTDQDRENALIQKGNCLLPGGEGLYLPCDEFKTYEMPKFLKKLNEIFGGTKAPPNIGTPN